MPKIKEFQEILRKKRIGFFISCNTDFAAFNYDIAYFSAYNGVGALIIPSKKKPFLLVSKMEKKRAEKSVSNSLFLSGTSLEVYSLPENKRLFEFIREKIRQKGLKSRRLGVNKEQFTLLLRDELKRIFKKFRLVDLRKELARLREQKTEEEIKVIRKGCRISDQILRECFREFKKFRKESDVGAFLEYEAGKRGCSTAFPPIVASGINSGTAHHNPEDTGLKKGFCIIDFGIRFRNYCTDTTRTIYLGKPSKKDIEAYNFLLGVQKSSIERIRLNGKCRELFEKAKEDLGDYSRHFTHGLGHGVGIKIHELPNIAGRSEGRIKENSVFTIEPAFYLKDFGIRIEDTVLAKKNKTEVLTRIGKEMIVKKADG